MTDKKTTEKESKKPTELELLRVKLEKSEEIIQKLVNDVNALVSVKGYLESIVFSKQNADETK